MSADPAAPTSLNVDRRQRSVDARDPAGEPPVVARLVVEIRSDGTRTIARAGFSDELTHDATVLEARGATPIALAFSLARHLVELTRPLLSRSRRSPAEATTLRLKRPTQATPNQGDPACP